MEIRVSQRGIGIITALVLAATAVLTVWLNIGGVFAAEDSKAEAAVKAQKYEYENETESYIPEVWWKAGLSDYKNGLTLISYEDVEVPTDENEHLLHNGVIVNDTGICYIEPDDDDYQAIQIIYDDFTDYSYTPGTSSKPQVQPESGYVTLTPGNFAFTTYGYGHGVGMSQNGANHYAIYSGYTYQQILDHYYPGTYLTADDIQPEDKITAGGVTGSVADIVSMVTYNEVGSSMAIEAIKAQAVAVYTYIMYNGGNAPDLHPKPEPPENVVAAVNSVLGEALCYDGSYALTMFCASSGGSTASCYDIFYQDIPYLRSVPCEYDMTCDPHYGTVEIISEDEVREQIEAQFGIELSDDPSNWITLTDGDGGYAATAVIDGQITVKGQQLRSCLGLKSPKFTVEYN